MIISLENKKIKYISKLLKKKNRDKENKFIVEGFHLVDEAKKANILEEIFTIDHNIEGTLVSNQIIKKISSTETPQPIVGICKKPIVKLNGNRILVLNNVQDPGNVGTLIRNAKAFNFDAVIVQGADIYSPKVIRSSQGAMFHLPVVQTNDVKSYFKEYQLIGAILNKDAIQYNKVKLENKFMLILGNEGQGIERDIIELLDKSIYIPISFESLNVASAGAILLNEYKESSNE